MATVTFDQVSLQYPGTDRPAVKDLTLEIADGELLVLVGPSGCGKSTALRLLAGLEEADAGRILIGGEDLTQAAPKDRDIAMVFQNYALYPHMTVAENMGFALKIAGIDKEERAQRVRAVAEQLDLVEYLGRKPQSLSGGQRQRVAMGRAIVRAPRVFLMDEPLSNLDAKLRVQTRTRIAALQRELGVTTVYVTHDQTEALTMGHRIAVMEQGVLQQVGTPRELLDRPQNLFVAGFIGSPAMNLLPTAVSGDRLAFGGTTLRIDAQVSGEVVADQIIVGVRPEDLRICGADEAGLEVHVELVEELGADGYLYGHAESGGKRHEIVIRVDGREHPDAGDRVRVLPVRDRVHLFDARSKMRIGSLDARH